MAEPRVAGHGLLFRFSCFENRFDEKKLTSVFFFYFELKCFENQSGKCIPYRSGNGIFFSFRYFLTQKVNHGASTAPQQQNFFQYPLIISNFNTLILTTKLQSTMWGKLDKHTTVPQKSQSPFSIFYLFMQGFAWSHISNSHC